MKKLDPLDAFTLGVCLVAVVYIGIHLVLAMYR